jgi:hypothetical protein
MKKIQVKIIKHFAKVDLRLGFAIFIKGFFLKKTTIAGRIGVIVHKFRLQWVSAQN